MSKRTAWHQSGSLRQEQEIEAFVGAAAHHFGRVDAVFANTGRYSIIMREHGITGWATSTVARLGYDPDYKPDILGLPRAAWNDTLDLMVLAAVSPAKFATPHLIAAGGGDRRDDRLSAFTASVVHHRTDAAGRWRSEPRTAMTGILCTVFRRPR